MPRLIRREDVDDARRRVKHLTGQDYRRCPPRVPEFGLIEIKRGSAVLRRDGAARATLWLEALRARAPNQGREPDLLR